MPGKQVVLVTFEQIDGKELGTARYAIPPIVGHWGTCFDAASEQRYTGEYNFARIGCSGPPGIVRPSPMRRNTRIRYCALTRAGHRGRLLRISAKDKSPSSRAHSSRDPFFVRLFFVFRHHFIARVGCAEERSASVVSFAKGNTERAIMPPIGKVYSPRHILLKTRIPPFNDPINQCMFCGVPMDIVHMTIEVVLIAD